MKVQPKNIGTVSPILVWDTSDTDEEVEHRLTDESYYEREDWLEEYKRDSGNKEAALNDPLFQEWINEKKKESVQRDIWEDADHWDSEWEFLIDSLREILDRKNFRNCKWRIEGSNMGWMRRSGYKYIDCASKGRISSSDAREFLREILPNTDCRFRIYEQGRSLRIMNYHHDAPTGETYICTPCGEAEWQENV